ncbi:uncharacterized protein PADG_01357 [Paracoccidioides brasiliensis Pb18]|uniref:Uncharacterized protein n=1 Tax=Paracoccidioides brasiliensis (strain Pb18) TaxID=502780 RepID=C1G341_PARBD|nr:uncharacterized protein PADG_01357 [Paracoccidioides brasiliensis Pb18]EEH45207.2 hypothetical protein PADG_01357 [Paracoccidioides brasiliensis Pb18]
MSVEQPNTEPTELVTSLFPDKPFKNFSIVWTNAQISVRVSQQGTNAFEPKPGRIAYIGISKVRSGQTKADNSIAYDRSESGRNSLDNSEESNDDM